LGRGATGVASRSEFPVLATQGGKHGWAGFPFSDHGGSGGYGATDWNELTCAENIAWYPGRGSDVPRADKPDF
jgi:hypothetical protein